MTDAPENETGETIEIRSLEPDDTLGLRKLCAGIPYFLASAGETVRIPVNDWLETFPASWTEW